MELIERQAAIDAIRNMCEECDSDYCGECRVGRNDCEKVLEGLPSAQQWIPCSERLPDNDDSVLISNSHGVTKAWWNGKFWTSIAVKKYKTVTAWMPLPEPYQEEGE